MSFLFVVIEEYLKNPSTNPMPNAKSLAAHDSVNGKALLRSIEIEIEKHDGDDGGRF